MILISFFQYIFRILKDLKGKLTLVLLAANLVNRKRCEKSWKMTETQENGFSSDRTLQELSYEYQHGRVWKGFKNFCVHVPLMNGASALKGLLEFWQQMFCELSSWGCHPPLLIFSHLNLWLANTWNTHGANFSSAADRQAMHGLTHPFMPVEMSRLILEVVCISNFL